MGPLSSLLPALNHTVPLEYSKYLCKSLSTKKKHDENKNSSPKTQTTRDASFGPVIVEVSVYKGIRVFLYIKCTYIYQLILKKHEEKKKHSPKAQTTRGASFGPVTVVVAPHRHPCVFQYFESTYIYQLILKKHEERKKNTHLRPKRREARRLGQLQSSLPSTNVSSSSNTSNVPIDIN